MPDLSALDMNLAPRRAIGLVMSNLGPRSLPAAQLANSFVRMVDKAVMSYELARHEFEDYASGGSVTRFFRGQGHLETCIQSAHRALCFVARLRRFGFSMPDGSPLVPRRRDLEVLGSGAEGKVRSIRDAIEHIDHDLMAGRIVEGQAVAVDPGPDAFEVAGVSLPYDIFARWLTQLHGLARGMNRYREPSTETRRPKICEA